MDCQSFIRQDKEDTFTNEHLFTKLIFTLAIILLTNPQKDMTHALIISLKNFENLYTAQGDFCILM